MIALQAAYRRELVADRRPRPGRRAGPAPGHRGARRPGRPHPAGGARGRRRRPGRAGGAVPAGDRRRWARRVGASSTTSPTSTWSSSPNRATARPGGRRRRALANATYARRLRDADLPGGRLGGRRGAATRGQGRPAGPDARQSRGVLPAVGEHLGVPGPAQGPAGRRRPRSGPVATSRPSRRWCGVRPSGRTSSPTCRRCAAGSSPTCRPRSPTGRSSSAGAGCATSSSPCSCCNSSTVAATSRCACAATLSALAALRDGGYVGRDDAFSLDDAYRFLRTAEHRLQLRRLRRTHLVPEDAVELDWLARTMGFRPDGRGDARAVWRVGVGVARPRGAPPAREALLPAAARGGGARAVRRAAAHSCRGGPTPDRPGFRRRRPARCATSSR